MCILVRVVKTVAIHAAQIVLDRRLAFLDQRGVLRIQGLLRLQLRLGGQRQDRLLQLGLFHVRVLGL